MLLVAFGWIYVVLMVAVVQAMSSNGTVLGALLTFAFYGLLPVGLLVYLMLSPARRRRARRRAEEAGRRQAAPVLPDDASPSTMPMPMPMPASSAPGLDPDGRGHAPGDPVPAKGKEA